MGAYALIAHIAEATGKPEPEIEHEVFYTLRRTHVLNQLGAACMVAVRYGVEHDLWECGRKYWRDP